MYKINIILNEFFFVIIIFWVCYNIDMYFKIKYLYLGKFYLMLISLRC